MTYKDQLTFLRDRLMDGRIARIRASDKGTAPKLHAMLRYGTVVEAVKWSSLVNQIRVELGEPEDEPNE